MFLLNSWNNTYRVKASTLEAALRRAHDLANDRQALVGVYEVVEGRVEHRATVGPEKAAVAVPEPVAAPAGPRPPRPNLGPEVTPLVDLFDLLD